MFLTKFHSIYTQAYVQHFIKKNAYSNFVTLRKFLFYHTFLLQIPSIFWRVYQSEFSKGSEPTASIYFRRGFINLNYMIRSMQSKIGYHNKTMNLIAS